MVVKIDNYRFGQMTVNGNSFSKDLILSKEKIIKSNWWRQQGHSLVIDDLNMIIDKTPALLIIGTGASGVMSVPKSTQNKLKEEGFKLKILETPQAVKAFNAADTSQTVIGAFHLTC